MSPPSLQLEIVEIAQLPLYNQDLDDDGAPPDAWTAFRERVKPYDAVLFVTPEYNRSVPAPLKNAIDVGSRPYGQSVWDRKPGAVVSASPGAIGGFGANQHLRQSLVFLNVPCLQMPEVYLGGIQKKFDEKGALSDDGTRKFLAELPGRVRGLGRAQRGLAVSITQHAEPRCREAGEPALELLIEARGRDLGDGFRVRRLLPAAGRRMVGPFIFFDHMGPVRMLPGQGLDVRPHPHIHLATVTYLFEGEILHRDSLGTQQSIRPGALNWMTAGRGIAHSERSPGPARKEGARLHGLQLWVALPRADEEVAPSFQHHAAEDLPALEREGARLRVIAGSAYGATSPVRVLSPLFYVEAQLEQGAALSLPDEHPERAAYVVDGSVCCDGEAQGPGVMLVFREGVPAQIRAQESSRVMLLGGAPLDGERHIWWNFVSSSPERIEQARRDWREGRFPKVPGDELEFIPLPDSV